MPAKLSWERTCTGCARPFVVLTGPQQQKIRTDPTVRLYCSRQCCKRSQFPDLPAACAKCGVAFLTKTKEQRAKVRTGKRVFCSVECTRQVVAVEASTRMATTNRKYASARMKANPISRRPEVRAKISATLKGRAPTVQGGNGRETPEPVKMLAAVLGDEWEVEANVVTGMGRHSGYPSVYKIDLADPERQIAIEVDGGSHGPLERKALDAKKTEFLQSLGWTVLRFTNVEVLADTAKCAETVTSTTSKLRASILT